MTVEQNVLQQSNSQKVMGGAGREDGYPAPLRPPEEALSQALRLREGLALWSLREPGRVCLLPP